MRSRRDSTRAGETKRSQTKRKRNRRFRFAPQWASFGALDEIDDFAIPCGFNSLCGVSFRRAKNGPGRGGKVSRSVQALSPQFRFLPSNCPSGRLKIAGRVEAAGGDRGGRRGDWV
jgi:hypothetical protein